MTNSSDSTFTRFLTDRVRASDAYVNGDLAPLAAISTERAPATIYPPTGTVVVGPVDVDAFNRRGVAMFSPGAENEIEVVHAAESGDLAYLVGVQRSRVRFADAPEPVDMALRLTEVFRREGGDWKLVHRHADPLAEPEPASA